jgi:hypothetical protein
MEGTRYAGFFDPVLLLTRKRKLQATSPSSLIEKPKRGEAHEESNIWYKTHHKCCLHSSVVVVVVVLTDLE